MNTAVVAVVVVAVKKLKDLMLSNFSHTGGCGFQLFPRKYEGSPPPERGCASDLGKLFVGLRFFVLDSN